jgi:hypothetical protein
LQEVKVTNIRSSRTQANLQSWSKIAPYTVLFLCSFLCALVPLALLLWKAEKVVELGLTGIFYYLVLSLLGLSSAAFLFGALHSYARYRGKIPSGMLQLGGPVVAFLIVIILGFWLAPAALNFPLRVYAHGAGGPQDLVLRGSGYIIIDTRDSAERHSSATIVRPFFPKFLPTFAARRFPSRSMPMVINWLISIKKLT